ncbi:hypothetical protein GLE_1890 [Lysobacter enzymogenes]|uniref:Uncharacterized protein n=1 Tax=Lysobacter enzymogenes TaxID=69 RepID=A0A0S2DF95_LYSEN|nr:hypothetical protein GLE_1890 [Lysobacter enzymogenes]
MAREGRPGSAPARAAPARAAGLAGMALSLAIAGRPVGSGRPSARLRARRPRPPGFADAATSPPRRGFAPIRDRRRKRNEIFLSSPLARPGERR